MTDTKPLSADELDDFAAMGADDILMPHSIKLRSMIRSAAAELRSRRSADERVTGDDTARARAFIKAEGIRSIEPTFDTDEVECSLVRAFAAVRNAENEACAGVADQEKTRCAALAVYENEHSRLRRASDYEERADEAGEIAATIRSRRQQGGG